MKTLAEIITAVYNIATKVGNDKRSYEDKALIDYIINLDKELQSSNFPKNHAPLIRSIYFQLHRLTKRLPKSQSFFSQSEPGELQKKMTAALKTIRETEAYKDAHDLSIIKQHATESLSLDLSFLYVTVEQLCEFSEITNLTSLNFSGTKINHHYFGVLPKDDLASVVDFIQSFKALGALFLSYAWVNFKNFFSNDKSTSTWWDNFPKLQQLRHLDLSYNFIDDSAIPLILQACSNLTYLNLEGNFLQFYNLNKNSVSYQVLEKKINKGPSINVSCNYIVPIVSSEEPNPQTHLNVVSQFFTAHKKLITYTRQLESIMNPGCFIGPEKGIVVIANQNNHAQIFIHTMNKYGQMPLMKYHVIGRNEDNSIKIDKYVFGKLYQFISDNDKGNPYFSFSEFFLYDNKAIDGLITHIDGLASKNSQELYKCLFGFSTPFNVTNCYVFCLHVLKNYLFSPGSNDLKILSDPFFKIPNWNLRFWVEKSYHRLPQLGVNDRQDFYVMENEKHFIEFDMSPDETQIGRWIEQYPKKSLAHKGKFEVNYRFEIKNNASMQKSVSHLDWWFSFSSDVNDAARETIKNTFGRALTKKVFPSSGNTSPPELRSKADHPENIKRTRSTNLVEKTEEGNSASQLFLKEKAHDFNTWYSADICACLLQVVPNKAQCIRVDFNTDVEKENIDTFKKYLAGLIELTRTLQKPGLFISMEPGARNHFICGIIHNNKLVLVNPTGLSEKEEFIETMRAVREEMRVDIYLSKNRLQKDIVSCGPISLEFAINILTLSPFYLDFFFNQLQPDKSASTFYTLISIDPLLPPSLKQLEILPKEASIESIRSIRVAHYEKLKCLPKVNASEPDIEDNYKNTLLAAPAQSVLEQLVVMGWVMNDISQGRNYALLLDELKVEIPAEKTQHETSANDIFVLETFSQKLTALIEDHQYGYKFRIYNKKKEPHAIRIECTSNRLEKRDIVSLCDALIIQLKENQFIHNTHYKIGYSVNDHWIIKITSLNNMDLSFILKLLPHYDRWIKPDKVNALPTFFQKYSHPKPVLEEDIDEEFQCRMQ